MRTTLWIVKTLAGGGGCCVISNLFKTSNYVCIIEELKELFCVLQWRSQPEIWSCKFFCVYRPYKESISKEMSNDNDLNLRSMTKFSDWLRYTGVFGVAIYRLLQIILLMALLACTVVRIQDLKNKVVIGYFVRIKFLFATDN